MQSDSDQRLVVNEELVLRLNGIIGPITLILEFKVWIVLEFKALIVLDSTW